MMFNKRSIDGSAKANLMRRVGDKTWGELYEIEKKDLEKLDRVEIGYSRIIVRVYLTDSETVEAITYVSNELTDEQVAYDSYKTMIINGAREHNLPEEYIAYLKQLQSKHDSTDAGISH
ncbi:MAG: hypothetical protein AA908_10250 [Chlorobi bacterium NICIL-2]|nr:MAG: hypothetical protein AA908_10250 [Chlorobi bacterium NICIL-2]